MRLIAHRGNTHGSKPMLENSPKYVDEALKAGFDAEVDLWVVGGMAMLGHNQPQYEVDRRWFYDRFDKLWVHCKNAMALEWCHDSAFNFFYHETDTFTLTSNKFIWAYPGKEFDYANVVCVLPEAIGEVDLTQIVDRNYHAICSDYVGFLNVQGN
jgi:hypothetical protein